MNHTEAVKLKARSYGGNFFSLDDDLRSSKQMVRERLTRTSLASLVLESTSWHSHHSARGLPDSHESFLVQNARVYRPERVR